MRKQISPTREKYLEILTTMLDMTVDERVEYVDAFISVLETFNPNQRMMYDMPKTEEKL